MITIVVVSYLFTLVTSGVLLLEGLATAPMGYQDEWGFHYGKPLGR